MGSNLQKHIGMPGVFSIAAGAMISSGLFVLPGLAFAKAGPAMILSYALAGLMIIPAMLAQSEMATAMPRSGGTYFFVERSLGPLAGTLAGLLNWFSVALKAAFALVGIGAAVAVLFPDLSPFHQQVVIRSVAAAGCVFFTVINLVGVHESVRFQNILVAILIVIVIIYILLGAEHIRVERFGGFMDKGFSSMLGVAGMVFVSYGGLTKVAGVAEEVKNPGRNLPWGMILAFIVVNILYIASIWVTVGILEPTELADSYAPLALGAARNFGSVGKWLLEIGAMAAFITTANAGLFASSRSPLAMSRDGLVPEWFSRTTPETGIPRNSLLATSGIMIALIVTLDLENLVKTASTMMILMFLFVNVALIIMRQSRFQSYRPVFRAPGYPYMQIVAIITYAFVLVEMGKVPLLLTLGFALVACVWYIGYVHRRVDREGALAHLVKQTFSQDMRRANLEEELVWMALERNNNAMDRFDGLVRDCLVFDLEKKTSAEDFFALMAGNLSEAAGLDKQKLNEMFIERERNSSTVMEQGLAIPHLLVPGEKKFIMAMVRAREGIFFDEIHAPVTMAFVLLGTEDERNFHLKCLMNIAHIVQEPEFRERWNEANSDSQLRDLVIITRRNRK